VVLEVDVEKTEEDAVDDAEEQPNTNRTSCRVHTLGAATHPRTTSCCNADNLPPPPPLDWGDKGSGPATDPCPRQTRLRPRARCPHGCGCTSATWCTTQKRKYRESYAQCACNSYILQATSENSHLPVKDTHNVRVTLTYFRRQSEIHNYE